MASYCLKCKKHTTTAGETTAVTANGSPIQKGKCVVCGARKSQFLPSKQGGDIVGAINKAGKEFHVLGFNFYGPGTNLSK